MDEEKLAQLFEEYYEEDNSEGLQIIDLQSPIENSESTDDGCSKGWQ